MLVLWDESARATDEERRSVRGSRERTREARLRLVGSDVDRDERKGQNGRDKERTGIMRFPPSSLVDNSGSERERRKREEKEERRRKGDRWQKERRWSASRGQKAPPRNFERRLLRPPFNGDLRARGGSKTARSAEGPISVKTENIFPSVYAHARDCYAFTLWRSRVVQFWSNRSLTMKYNENLNSLFAVCERTRWNELWNEYNANKYCAMHIFFYLVFITWCWFNDFLLYQRIAFYECNALKV